MQFDLADVKVRSIVSAEESVLRSLVEISMKGNRYSLDDEEKYRASWDYFASEFRSFDTESQAFLIAELGGQIVGFVRVRRKPNVPKEWWLLGLEVREEYRRRGIGTKLINRSLEQVSARGGKSVLSYTHKSNVASLAAHQKAGFEILSDRFARFDGSTVEDEDHWLMRASLPQDTGRTE